jgi:hypothetical protein
LRSPQASLDFAAVAAQVDQLARVLGPDWQGLRFSQLAARAHSLEQAAQLNRALAAYMVETATETAGEALARLQPAQDDDEEWRSPTIHP